jgi:hypothetical protein
MYSYAAYAIVLGTVLRQCNNSTDNIIPVALRSADIPYTRRPSHNEPSNPGHGTERGWVQKTTAREADNGSLKHRLDVGTLTGTGGCMENSIA